MKKDFATKIAVAFSWYVILPYMELSSAFLWGLSIWCFFIDDGDFWANSILGLLSCGFAFLFRIECDELITTLVYLEDDPTHE